MIKPEESQNVIFRGAGESLWPVVRHGALLEISNKEKILSGDIAVFSERNRWIAHQVLKTRFYDGSSWFFLKGNGLKNVDGWIPAYRILGKVASVNGISTSNPIFRVLLFTIYFRLKSQWELYRFLFYVKKQTFPNMVSMRNLYEVITSPFIYYRLWKFNHRTNYRKNFISSA